MKRLSKVLLLAAITCFISCNANTKNNEKTIALGEEMTPPTIKENTIQVALLLDTSNSMDGLIDQAKAQLWQIVNELSYAKCENERPDLEIALYEYGNDNLSDTSGYIRQVLAFTDNLDDISEKLFSLTTNGGSEYCGKVIKTSLDDLSWRKGRNDLKLIFIAGNEPFTQGPVHYKDASADAKEKDVTINTIFCGEYNHGISGMWQDGAKHTNGDYMSINHNAKTVHISSPYDELILELNIKLNGTYLHYGSLGEAAMARQGVQDSNAASYGSGNAVSRTVTKSSKFYKNSSWDLVDAEQEEDFDISKVDKKALPKELQNKSEKEIKAIIESKREERENIQEKIQELNKKRLIFIADEKKKNATNNHLENALMNAIKKQAAEKNYSWEE